MWWPLQLTIGTLLFGATLWLSIRILNPSNTRNTFVAALCIGFAYSFIGLLIGGLLFMIPVFILYFILVKYYDTGLIQGILILVLFMAVNYLLRYLLGAILAP